jgi:hypothetical protein
MSSKIKEFFEHLFVDTQQIVEHVSGVSEITHYTRPCLLCQPINAKLQFPNPTVSVLPATFPSDLEYEMLKQKSSTIRTTNISGKQLILINDDEYDTKVTTRLKRPVWIKELVLFLHTLGYVTFNPIPLYWTQTKIKNQQVLNQNDEENQIPTQQKFLFLCWGAFNASFLQKMLIVCNSLASQIVLWIIDKPDEERKLNKTTIPGEELDNRTDNVFGVHFVSIPAVRRFHFMLLQREGRVTVENVINYASTTLDVETFIHTKKEEQIESRKNLSFIY